ncbi:hypothetical protein [Caballeronia sordidicola]|uniref:hypothetical protein n=1 Tax=Caballeronia sordidicola TaxID=196367 RepID=UPI0004CFFAE8|nr:hypothetical protein [Caballeronia sordidicola]
MSTVFLDIKNAVIALESRREMHIRADGSLTISVDELCAYALDSRRAMPAQGKVHETLLRLGFKRASAGRYAIERADFNELKSA